jgi:hypothetical protein
VLTYQDRQQISDFVVFVLYWVALGIASSIGLGTGFHTFILYLGPHVAKVVLAANECNAVPELLPNRWKFHYFGPCPADPTPGVHIGLWTIFKAVFLEAFCWGAGTAIGELPPYFVSRAASIAGQKTDDVDEILADPTNSMSDEDTDQGQEAKKKEPGFFQKH